MAPIRVCIIGLSSGTGEKGGFPNDGWAANAHLPYLLSSPKYTITALCNSSLTSAQAAIKHHNLPSTTKAYGSAEDVAADPDIDLVVVCVRVDRHHAVTMPSLRAGKDVFVEWPLASNVADAQEMLDAAAKSGSRTAVGLQGRASPFVQKIRELVQTNAIGDLLSSNLAYAMDMPGAIEPLGVSYMAKKSIGGSLHTIVFSHVSDSVFFALGGLKDVSAKLTTRWKETKLLTPEGKFDKMIPRETPDHIMMYGTLGNNDAPVDIFVRNGKGFKGSPNLVWRVLGTTGELRLTASGAVGIPMGIEKLEVYDHLADEVKEIPVEYSDEVKDVPGIGKVVAQVYELFAERKCVEEGLVSFEEAFKSHKIIDAMEKSSEGAGTQTLA